MKTRLFLLFGIVFIVIASLIISSLINVTISTANQKEKISQNLQDHSSRLMKDISIIMHERISDLKIMTDSSNSIITSSDSTIKEKANYLRMFERTTKTYSSISIYDVSGKKIVDTRNFELGKDVSEQPFFINALQGEIYFDEIPLYLDTLNTEVIHFSAPIIDDSGKLSGVLTATFPMYKFHQILTDDSYLQELEIDLISQEGEILYSNHDRASILSFGLDNMGISQQTIESMSTNEHGIEINQNDENIFYVVVGEDGYLSYPGNNWHLLLGIPSSVAFENIEESQITLYTITGMILVFSILLSIIFSNKLSKPISTLTNAINKIEKNDYSIQIKPDGPDEVKKLGIAFNSMSLAIKNHKDELQELDKAKNEFTSMITHEIKNPLVPIVGYADMLLQESSLGKLTEKQKNAMQIILKNSLALERLTSDFLDVQKLDLGKMNFDKQVIPNDYIIDEVYKQHKILLEQSNVEFKKTISKIKYLHIDENRIMQIFNNLLLNSLSYLPKDNRKIEIGTFQQNSDILFYVKDNGHGIPLPEQINLFKKFHQADTSITRKHGGSGLGLSISKGIVEAHDGKIWCESEPDMGTKMSFSIPIKEITIPEKQTFKNLIQKQRGEVIEK